MFSWTQLVRPSQMAPLRGIKLQAASQDVLANSLLSAAFPLWAHAACCAFRAQTAQPARILWAAMPFSADGPSSHTRPAALQRVDVGKVL